MNALIRPAPEPTDDPLETRAGDYARMADALVWLADRWREHPSLDAAAAASGMSPHHFQRVFTRWAGVSPKVFTQALAHAQAHASLAAGESVLDAAFDAGFSGPSRLHDLFVGHEGVTPGQARRRGEGVRIRWGFAPSPFGRAILAATSRGLCGLGFVEPHGEAAAETDLRRRWPAADWIADDAAARAAATAAFGGEGAAIELIGPPFHVAVWKALLRIPPGRTATYGHVAALAGRPGAHRATGAAIGANPISWLIPCHRVIAADGRLTGYHWGLPRKVAMLGLEAVAAYGRRGEPGARATCAGNDARRE